jgi:tetratricopeptide (TPR) repeat protein
MTSINKFESVVRADSRQDSISLDDITDGVRKVYDYFVKDPWKLPVIMFAWPLLLLSACSRKTAVSENRNPSPVFNESSSPLAHRLYQGLLSSGVSPASIDSGYQIINYNNTYCPGRGPSCLLGAGDNLIKPEEVFEYALNNYTRHRALIEDTLGDPIPWELDDLNPATSFDAEIRNKIMDAVNTLKGILAENGYVEDTEEYKNSLAVGAFWVAAFPKAESMSGKINLQYLRTRLEEYGIGQFVDYLSVHRGLGLELDDTTDYTALEALRVGKGDCSESAEILFSVFRMAGLNPKYVMVRLKVSDADNLEGGEDFRNDERIGIMELVAKNPYFNHVCVALEFGGNLRLFDPMHFQMNARYSEYFPITSRQHWSQYYTNEGMYLAAGGDYARSIQVLNSALLLDPLNSMAIMNMGGTHLSSGKLSDAMTQFSRAIQIDPSISRAYYFRGISYFRNSEWQNGFTDLTQFIKMEPNMLYFLQNEIFNYYTLPKWEDNPQEEVIARETGLEVAKAEALYITCCVSWMLNLRDRVRDTFRIMIANNLTVTGTPSEFTVNYFEEMFRNMPEDMREDEQISGMIESIRQKLRQ